MEALIGLLWFLGLVAVWAVASGLFLIFKRCMFDPIVGMLVDRWRGKEPEWAWWV